MSDHAHGAPVPASSGLKQPYHLVDPSPWPIIGALGAALIVTGIVLAAHYGSYAALVIGALIAFTVMFFWWRDVIRESRIPGLYSPVVRLGLRYGMMFFICSEVMFFVAFFWAFFNYALFPENVA
ncbi:MAG TPA: cytochrome c oxidase subunit 3, partial [Acetobacteraceae bacterium]